MFVCSSFGSRYFAIRYDTIHANAQEIIRSIPWLMNRFWLFISMNAKHEKNTAIP